MTLELSQKSFLLYILTWDITTHTSNINKTSTNTCTFFQPFRLLQYKTVFTSSTLLMWQLPSVNVSKQFSVDVCYLINSYQLHDHGFTNHPCAHNKLNTHAQVIYREPNTVTLSTKLIMCPSENTTPTLLCVS